MEILVYQTSEDTSPFAQWFHSLDGAAAAKITTGLIRLGLGNTSNVKSVGTGVFELKIDFGPAGLLWQGWTRYRHPAGWRYQEQRDIEAAVACWLPTRREKKARAETPLTRSFKDTVKVRAERDPAFRDALLVEAVDVLLAGDVETGKVILRDYVNATVGFERLADETGTPAKSLMRMLGPHGNPNARKLFAILERLQNASGVSLSVRPTRS